MATNNEEPFQEVDQSTQRLVRDLERLYGTGQQDAEHLTQIRTRLFFHQSEERSSPSDTPRAIGTSHEQGVATNGSRRKVVGGVWSHRIGQVAAVFITALLVGAMLLVFSHIPHSPFGSASTHQPSPTTGGSHTMRSMQMIDASTGWAMTEQAVLRTTDGGNHWTNVTPSHLQLSRQSVATFQNATRAWVAVPRQRDATIQLWRSTDGGVTWQSSSLQGPFPKAVTFVDAFHGWLLAGQYGQGDAAAETIRVYRSNDGGKTWEDMPTAAALAASTDAPPAGHLPYGGQKSGIYFLNASTGWVSGKVIVHGLSWLYVTHDGGATWHQQTLVLPVGTPSAPLVIEPPTFFGAQDGLLPVTFVGVGMVLYVTHDAGTTWQPTSLVPTAQATTTFVDIFHGWLTDGSRLFVTTDGGHYWIQYPPNTTFKNVTALSFVSSTLGWAVSIQKDGASSVLKTQDGGLTWSLPTTLTL